MSAKYFYLPSPKIYAPQSIEIGSYVLNVVFGPTQECVFLSAKNMKGNVLDASGSLRKILDEHFAGHDEDQTKCALLTSEVYNVAIWKQGESCYLFDPNACDANGNFSQSRLSKAKGKRNKRHKKDNAKEIAKTNSKNTTGDNSACVLWFESVVTLLMKILTNVPVEFIEHDAYFTPVTFNIKPMSKKAENLENWHKYIEITKDLHILRAHISQNDDKFLLIPNRNNQDVQMCLVALAFVSCLPCEDWTSDILDLMVKYGDRLYTRNYENVKHLKDYNEDKNESNQRWIYKIKPEHAARRFLIADCKIGVKFNEGVLTGLKG